MLTVIYDQATIDDLYHEFRQLLEELLPRSRPNFHIGHQVGSADADVYSTLKGDFWTCASGVNWNPFGLGNNPSMVVQINFTDGKSTRKSIGVFAKDEDGQLVELLCTGYQSITDRK